MTKLISGRVHKVPSANVSAERYQFLELSEAEPDLGLPSELGQVFTSDLDGNRYWSRLDTANVSETANLYFTNTRAIAALTNVDISFNNVIVYGDLTLLSSADIEGNPTLSDISGINSIGAQEVFADEVTSNIWHNIYTSNVVELNNLYFTNTRAVAALTNVDISFNNVIVYGDLTLLGSADIEGNPTLSDISGINSIGAQEVFADEVTSNIWHNIYTSNVIESNNLYFTAQRAIAALQGNNITVNNLTVSGDLEVQGNLVSINTSTLNIEDKNIVLANGAISSAQADGAGITIAGANATLTYTNTGDKFVSNKDLEIQGNLIVGSGGTSNVFGINQLSAKNIIADTLTANSISATKWNGIYTANVIESSNNLYYTNDRVFSFVTGMSIGDLVDVANIYTYPVSNSLIGIQEGQALVWNGNIFIPVFVNSEVANVADLSVKVLSLENQTTANVREASSNLYFTNTRVLDAISLADISPNNVNANNIVTNSITANIWNRLYTANVIETAGNLYFTSQRARDSVSNSTGVYYNTTTGVFSIGQDVALTSDVQFRDLTLSGNLFILGNVAYIAANTLIINDPLIQLGIGNPGDQWDLGFVGHYVDGGQRHTGLFRDATDGKFKFFSNTTVEPGNVNYIDITEDSFRLASVVAESFEGNVIGTVSSIANHNTDALTEGSNNLYFTNVRAIAALTNVDISFNNVIIHGDLTLLGSADIEGNPTLSDISGINSIGAQEIFADEITSNIWHNIYTSNVVELNNLYFTNARVFSALTNADISFNNVIVYGDLTLLGSADIEGNPTLSDISGINSIGAQEVFADEITSNIWHNLYTANVIEFNNLYFTNARVLSNVEQMSINVLADVDLTGVAVNSALVWDGTKFIPGSTEAALRSNFANTAGSANVALLADRANLVSSLSNHNTSNLAEGTNLYFTNVRTVEAITPLLTTANILETTNQYFTNVRVLQVVDPKLTTANVIETSANLYFTNARVNTAVRPMMTTANVIETSANLYFTNARVLASLVNANVLVADLTAAGNLVANGLIIRGIFVNDNVLTGNVTITNITNANILSANIVSSQVWQGLYTANVIETSANLYFTNTRARAAFLPGKGIAISGDGVITNTGAPFEYNVGIDGSGYANVLSSMSRLVTFSGTSTRDRFLLRSLHITNVSGTDAVISGNVLYATGNTAFFANLLPVPADSAVELMLNTQLFQPNDIVNLQGFTSTGVATSNLLQAVYTFETFSQDNTYQGTGQTLAASNTDILVYDSASTFSIIESIKVVNLDNRIIPVRVYWADANNVIKAHLAFNTQIPPNSSFETISTPKRISTGDRLFARFNNAPNNSVSIFISARLGYNYAVSGIVSNVSPSGTASASFSSSEPDGTLLYYTIE